MNEWTYNLRLRKRIERCLICCVIDGKQYATVCHCGKQVPPPKWYRTRIVRRRLAREVRKMVQENE